MKSTPFNEIKKLTQNSGSIYSLLLLDANRIASCSCDKTIRIYNQSNDYHCDEIIERHTDEVTSICKLDDGTLVSSSEDHSIKIGEFTISNTHQNSIWKVVSLPENRIASCSSDTTIKIWNSAPPYSDTPIKVLRGNKYSVNSILYIPERDILISGSNDPKFLLWNMSTYQCVSIISDVGCCTSNSLYQIDRDTVIVGDWNYFSIVNISSNKCKIEHCIKDEQLGFVNCFIKLKDNKMILCGCDKKFCLYDMETNSYTINNSNHKETFSDFICIKESLFASSSFENSIKVWSY